jgi:hypothetical protein
LGFRVAAAVRRIFSSAVEPEPEPQVPELFAVPKLKPECILDLVTDLDPDLT